MSRPVLIDVKDVAFGGQSEAVCSCGMTTEQIKNGSTGSVLPLVGP